MRTRFLTAVALLVSLVPVSAAASTPDDPRSARAGSVTLTLVVEAEHPQQFVIQEIDQIISAVDGKYTVPLREDGTAFVTVRALREDGTPGPWLSAAAPGAYVYSYSRTRSAGFEIDASSTTIGPLKVEWPFPTLPMVPEEPVGDIDTFDYSGAGYPGSVAFSASLYDLPTGSSTVLDFYGCAGVAPVASYTSYSTGFNFFMFGVDADQLGPSGRVVVTVRRPGSPDFALSQTVRTRQKCDPHALRVDDLGFNMVPFLNIDEIDSRNTFPVWRRGAHNPLPEAAVTWSTASQVARTRLRAGTQIVPRLARRIHLESFYAQHYRWSVGGRRVASGNDRSFLRLKPSWVGKVVKVKVTIVPEVDEFADPGYHWDGTVSKTFRVGRVRR